MTNIHFPTTNHHNITDKKIYKEDSQSIKIDYLCAYKRKFNFKPFINQTMKKSALQVARAAYEPKLPIVLTGAVKAVAGEATQSVADQDAIKALFPNTYGLPELVFEKNDTPTKGEPINVGVILSGGQAPGGHNVISGLFDGIKKINKASRLYGFLMGPGGFVDHKYIELTDDIINEYRNTGGFDIIGSGRTKLEKQEQFDKGLEILKELGIKALVIIGGDDSNTNAAVLAEYYKHINARLLTETLKTNKSRHRLDLIPQQRFTVKLSAISNVTVTQLVNIGISSNSWVAQHHTSPLNAHSRHSQTSA